MATREQYLNTGKIYQRAVGAIGQIVREQQADGILIEQHQKYPIDTGHEILN